MTALNRQVQSLIEGRDPGAGKLRAGLDAGVQRLYLIEGHFGASMLLFFYVLQFLDVTVASKSLYLVPVFGTALAALLLGERLGLFAIIGAVTVLVSSILVMNAE